MAFYGNAVPVYLAQPVPRKGENFVGPKPKWIHDSDRKNCVGCEKKFKFKRHGGRHHCRGCGDIFCKKCLSTTCWSYTGLYKTYKSLNSVSQTFRCRVRACYNCN